MLRRLFGRPPVRSRRNRPLNTKAEVLVVGHTGDLTRMALKSVGGNAWVPTGGSGRASELPVGDPGYARAYSASVWAYRCANIRAGKVAEQLHNAQLVDTKSEKPVGSDHPYHEAIAYAFERYEQEFYFDLAINSYIFGESYVEKFPARMQITERIAPVVGPGGVRVLPSLLVEPLVLDGELAGYELYLDDGRVIDFTTDEVVRYKLYNPMDTMRGQSIMGVALDSVNVDMYVVRFAKKYYQNGARPGIVFTPKELDLNDSDMDSIKDAVKNQVRGLDNWHKPLFLTRALEATLYPTPAMEDQGFLTADQRERIAAAFSVPVGLITFADSRYQFSPQQRKSFYEETIIPDVDRFVRWINVHIIPYFDPKGEVRLKANHSGIIALLDDRERQVSMVNDMFSQGGMSFNERRVALNLQPVENGDFFSLPAGRVFISTEQMSELTGNIGQSTVLGAVGHPSGTPSVTINSGGLPQRDSESPPNPSKSSDRLTDAPLRPQQPPQQSVEDELRAWIKNARNKGVKKACDFECYHLPFAVQHLVRGKLAALDENATHAEVESVFDEALARIKVIQATRLDFEFEFETLLEAARGEDSIARRSWAQRMRTLIRIYGNRAYRDGLRDGGVEIGDEQPLPPADAAIVNSLISEQSQYVSGFGEALYKAISDAAALDKPAMWFNKSIMPFYQAGLMSADENGMYEWLLGRTEEHCRDCARLEGQRHRYKDWLASGFMPQSDVLECWGFHCDCKLVRVVGYEKGSF